MRVCLFDIDGTLLNSMGAGKSALETALVEEFDLPEVRERVSYSGRTDRAIMRDLLRTHGLAETPEVCRRLVAGYLRRLPDALCRHQGRVLPGIAALLARLGQRERTAVGLLTGNLRAGAQVKLGHFGLYDFFAFGGYGDEHFDRDDVAREAMAVLADHVPGPVEPRDVWVIGDTPLDVRCARAVGVRVAAVATGWHTAEELAASQPDLLLRDLSDPTPLLEAWG